MKTHFKNSKGFTLIELLVVVAIIGLLASVVLASVNSARSKAKDAAVKEEVQQLATLATLNYNDYGSYCNLQYGWIGSGSNNTCNTAFSGAYASQASAICNNIINNANGGNPPYMFYPSDNVGCTNTFDFYVQLNDGNVYCSGSSGIKGEYGYNASFHNNDPSYNLGCPWSP
jgi:prepilin-type N-terminal cleavage/methylation domain-containing protein